MAFICTTTSGGENPGPARARALLQTRQAFVEEAFAPETDHIAAHGERACDVVIGVPLGSEQDHLGPEDLIIWQRIFSRATLQDLPLLPRELDVERALSGHIHASSSDAKVAEEPE
jgi:hypothetical protein